MPQKFEYEFTGWCVCLDSDDSPGKPYDEQPILESRQRACQDRDSLIDCDEDAVLLIRKFTAKLVLTVCK